MSRLESGRSITIKKSRVHGRGLFATALFRKGQTIFKPEGPVIRYSQPVGWRVGPHWLNVGKNRWLIPPKNSFWRFVNHSCAPNAIYSRGLRVVALRSVHPGEEITIDYSFTESHAAWRMRCHCHKSGCRKVIRSIQFLPEPLFRKYRQLIPLFLQQEYLKNKVEILVTGNKHQVVAKRRLKKGELVFKVDGPIIEYHRQRPNYRLGYRWLGVNDHKWIIPEEQSPWNSMRHSCSPNTGLNDACEIVTMKKVERGEELTIDNSITEADPRWRMKCSCGSADCRGVVRSIQFLPAAIYSKYFPYIPSFLRKYYNPGPKISELIRITKKIKSSAR